MMRGKNDHNDGRGGIDEWLHCSPRLRGGKSLMDIPELDSAVGQVQRMAWMLPSIMRWLIANTQMLVAENYWLRKVKDLLAVLVSQIRVHRT